MKKRMRKKLKGAAILLAVAAVTAGAAFFVVETKVSRQYTIVNSQKNEDVQSTEYVQLDDCMLKYAANGAVLLDKDLNTVWKKSYEMKNPVAEVQGETAVIADLEGTTLLVLNKESDLGMIETTLPILKAEVSENGMVAVILQDEDKTWINFYTYKGKLIAENQTRIDSPGYPVDLAVSPDGKTIMVSYLLIKDGQTTGYVAFYDFGTAGQGKVDHIVSGFTYENTIIPEVTYMKNGMAAAFRDNGYSVYSNDSAPKETVKKDINDEIISVFHDEEYIGIVNKGTGDTKYEMNLYDLAGEKKASADFNMEYDHIQLSGNRILIHSDEKMLMYNLRGRKKFECDINEGVVKNIFHLSMGHYVLISDNGIKIIKPKF